MSLPAGTVTLLFADIEGSTRLVERLRDGWGSVLADYRRILRDSAAELGGAQVDSQGDGLFFAFPRARAAVAAAAAAQRRLAEHRWPGGAQVRVRMGLHTGEPGLGDEGYLGLDVVRAARICAAAHGGQVLLSSATHTLLSGDPIEGVGTIDLGEYRLAGLPRPERIFQLVLAGLRTRFEPLRVERQEDESWLLHGRAVEDVVRDLRTSIEQRVADSLRGIDRQPPPRARRPAPSWTLLAVAAALVAAVVVPVIWLLVR